MKDGEVEDSDRELLGKIMVKRECLNAPMQYVFVHGISTNFSDEDKAMYNCRVLNTGETVFAYAENLFVADPIDWYEIERSRIRFGIKKADSMALHLRQELDVTVASKES